MKKSAVILIALLIFSVVFCHKNFADAKANISWTTTDVILDFKKCTVKGYFTNSGDTGGTISKIKFVVDVKTSKNGSQIYSSTWEHSPQSCYIPAGTQKKTWEFWYNDNGCPSWSAEKYWSVNWTTKTK